MKALFTLLALGSLASTALSQQGPGTESLAPPNQLAYDRPDAVYFTETPIATNAPTVLGQVRTWSVEPALPAGLAFDPRTGEISGTPSVASPATLHTVTAGNASGTTSASLRVEVRQRQAVDYVDNGFGQLLPHRTFRLDDMGLPTNEIIELRTVEDLVANVRSINPVLPPVTWPTMELLPNGLPGNAYLHARFERPIDLTSVLDGFGLTGTIVVIAVDGTTGTTFQVQGRAFVGGRTVPGPGGSPETWVVADPDDLDGDGFLLEAADVGGAFPGLGFPGTQGGTFAGDLELVDERSFVFVPDTDGDLSTPDGFPGGLQILLVAQGVGSTDGSTQVVTARASTTRGPDVSVPSVRFAFGQPDIEPQNGSIGVEPGSPVTVGFTEPMQPTTIGGLLSNSLLASLRVVATGFSGGSQGYTVPYRVRPRSAFDLTTWVYELKASFLSEPAPCSFGGIELEVLAGQAEDLSDLDLCCTVVSQFELASTTALANVAVTPDTIYVGRSQGLSVVDLNGCGGSTGDPTYSIENPIPPDSSNFPNNPNVALQGVLLVPPLQVGSCFFDGGSHGALSLATDSADSNVLVKSPTLGSISDMALGAPLDLVINNAQPFGCLQSGGNLCANTALQVFTPVLGGPNTLAPGSFGPALQFTTGGGNPVSWAPHPNPPPLRLPPQCADPEILGLEPTSVDTGPGLVNLLVPGPGFLGDPNLGIPPTNLLAREQNTFFQGPSPPQPSIQNCGSYAIRQHIGHFLYVADRSAGEVVVLNSNRMKVIARIEVPDPTSFAMSTNLDLLAITSQATDSVYFLSTDPRTPLFHGIVKVTAVGDAPSGIAWDPGNEDIFVCNEGDSSVSILSTSSLSVRKTLTGFQDAPFDVAITPRQDAFGMQRNVYFAWILDRGGQLSLFESGPGGINGWGFDDIIGELPFRFDSPQGLQPDPFRLRGGVTVLHAGKIDGSGNVVLPGGAVSGVGLNGPLGLQPLAPGATPGLRGLTFQVLYSVGEDVLSGAPVDLAFDNQRNFGALRNHGTVFSSGTPAEMNGKSPVRRVGTEIHNTSEPALLFLAIPDSQHLPGRIDVLDLQTGMLLDVNPGFPGVQSIGAPGVECLMDYFRQ